MAKLSDIQAKLDYLDGTKYMIKEAIINKGQEIIDDDVFRDFVEKINNITTSSNFINNGLSIYNTTPNDYTIGNVYNWNTPYPDSNNYDLDDYVLIQLFGSKSVTPTNPNDYFVSGYLLVKITDIEIDESVATKRIASTIVFISSCYPIYNNDQVSMSYENKDWYSYNYSQLDVQASNVLNNKKFLGSTGIEIGSMPNNGELNYTPTNNQQTIPAGYTSGGTISAMDITSSTDYNNCLALTQDILGI